MFLQINRVSQSISVYKKVQHVNGHFFWDTWYIVLFHKEDKVLSLEPLVIKLIVEINVVTNLNRA